MNVLIL